MCTHVLKTGVFQLFQQLRPPLSSSVRSGKYAFTCVYEHESGSVYVTIASSVWLEYAVRPVLRWATEALWVRRSTWELPRELWAIVPMIKSGPSSVCPLNKSHLCRFTQQTRTPPLDEPTESTGHSFVPALSPCVPAIIPYQHTLNPVKQY